MSYPSRQGGFFKKMLKFILVLLVLTGVVAGIWGFMTYCEWEKPRIISDKDAAIIGQRKTIMLTFQDQKTGLRDILVTVKQGELEKKLASVWIDQRGILEKKLPVEIMPGKLGLRDGEATLRISVTDYSLLHNTEVQEIPTRIDAVPPRISLLSSSHNVNPGGTCLVLFKITKPVISAVVKCGDNTYPATSMTIKNSPCYACFFAVPMDVSSSTPVHVTAVDKGGNQAQTKIPFYIQPKQNFRSDVVNLGNNFLTKKTAEFRELDPQLIDKTPEEIFSYVNSKVRMDNAKTIEKVCNKTEPQQLWSGTFLRMKSAATMALFGDKREYKAGGKFLGKSVHMGIDLASVKHAPVEAANNGIVVFADRLGIYGNTVIIDHGLGISSLYAHLHDIKVKSGQQVKRGETIGRTGKTGLAGGDHLHLGIMVHGNFVNPIEWWDSHWLKYNITNKFKKAADLL